VLSPTNFIWSSMKHIKVAFLGAEHVGKTKLVSVVSNYICKNDSPSTSESTEGIEITPIVVDDALTLYAWDFSGRENNEVTHSFFLTDNTIYVVVFNINSVLETSRLFHWLHTLTYYVSRCPILLVATHADTFATNREERINEISEEISARFPGTSMAKRVEGIFAVNCTKEKSCSQFCGTLLDVVQSRRLLLIPCLRVI